MPNSTKTIIKQSLLPLIFASTLSSLGGLTLMANRDKILLILPLVIIFPPLANMVGNYGTIIASKFTTFLELNEIPKRQWWKSHRLQKLFKTIFIIALGYTTLIAILANISAHLQGFPITPMNIIKILIICLSIAIFMTTTIFLTTVITGMWLAKQNRDPDNYLIPLVTGLADLGCLILFSTLVSLLF